MKCSDDERIAINHSLCHDQTTLDLRRSERSTVAVACRKCRV